MTQNNILATHDSRAGSADSMTEAIAKTLAEDGALVLNKHSLARPGVVTALAIWLVLLGIFALVGSLYLWGDGFLFAAPFSADHIMPVTDLLVTVPTAFIAAVGLWRLSWWGLVVSYVLAGILLYSSVAVYVMLAQQGSPYPPQFLLPPISGLALAATLIIVLRRNHELFNSNRVA